MSVEKEQGAAAVLAAVGLMADGPVRWGRPVPQRGPGVYVIELPAPLPAPPIELTRVGKWIERVPSLRLDGERPTSKALAARIAGFWLPSATILYVGSSPGSVGGRVHALQRHVIGDRRPHPDGHWIHLLTGMDRARVWWAQTGAAEEYLDAILDAFAASAGPPPEGRPKGVPLLPWANGRRPTGERITTGISGAFLPEDAAPLPAPGTTVVTLPPGDADGARTEPRGTGTTRRTGDAAALRETPRRAPADGAPRATPRSAAAKASAAKAARAEPIHLSQDALDRTRAELEELTQARRPEIVARIKAARELGDLRENAEYHAARAEQSFLEGRVRMLEDRIRNAVVIEAPSGAHVVLGSVVTIEALGVIGDEPVTYAIVGSAEADPRLGRISAASPVGAALLGAAVGDEVEVRTPRGPARYRVIAVD